MVIYKATDTLTGKSYIGKTINDAKGRMAQHLKASDNDKLFNAEYQKRKNDFTVDVIDRAEDTNSLNEKEKFWINFYKTQAPNGYNIYKGQVNPVEKLSKLSK